MSFIRIKKIISNIQTQNSLKKYLIKTQFIRDAKLFSSFDKYKNSWVLGWIRTEVWSESCAQLIKSITFLTKEWFGVIYNSIIESK